MSKFKVVMTDDRHKTYDEEKKWRADLGLCSHISY